MRKIIFIIGFLLLLFGCKTQQNYNPVQKAALDEIIWQYVDVSKNEGAPRAMSIAQVNATCDFHGIIWLCSDYPHIIKHWKYADGTLTETSPKGREKMMHDSSLSRNNQYPKGDIPFFNVAIANFMINGTNIQIDTLFGPLWGGGNIYTLSPSNVLNLTERLWVS